METLSYQVDHALNVIQLQNAWPVVLLIYPNVLHAPMASDWPLARYVNKDVLIIVYHAQVLLFVVFAWRVILSILKEYVCLAYLIAEVARAHKMQYVWIVAKDFI